MDNKDRSYAIVSDSSCDLPRDMAEKLGVTVVPFYVSFDSKHYMREVVDIAVRDFYDMMVDNPGVYPKSSTPTVEDYRSAFESILKDGKDIICICITEKFSGSSQTAKIAANIALSNYPDRRITVIDSTVLTVAQGAYIMNAAELCAQGVPYDNAVALLEKIKSTGRIFFTIGSIDYLRNGGRIGRLAGIAGTMLGIKPLITHKEGEIHNSGLARGRKNSIDKTIDLFINYVKDTGIDLKKYRLIVGYGYDYDEAVAFRDKLIIAIKDAVNVFVGHVPIMQIGATVSVHTGPYALGVGIMEKSSL